MAEDLEKVCTLLDKLTLDTLTLMEEQIQTKLELENCMCEGESNLAKTRYITGLNSVSQLQLPTEESPEFNAVAVVHPHEDDKLFGQNSYDLEIRKKPKNGENESYHDPIKWFGYLVPQSLHHAQNKFRQALLWAVRSANIQTELNETCLRMKQLYSIKAKLLKCEE